VREVDPNWRPKPSAYGTGIESEIRKANDLAGEAQARIAELGRVGVGPGPFAGESIPARGPSRDFTVQERALIDRIGYSTAATLAGREILVQCGAISYLTISRQQREIHWASRNIFIPIVSRAVVTRVCGSLATEVYHDHVCFEQNCGTERSHTYLRPRWRKHP
jgi:hypothetical protein